MPRCSVTCSDALGNLPPQMRLTMTHDNGHGISKNEKITENLQMTVYCASPYRTCTVVSTGGTTESFGDSFRRERISPRKLRQTLTSRELVQQLPSSISELPNSVGGLHRKVTKYMFHTLMYWTVVWIE